MSENDVTTKKSNASYPIDWALLGRTVRNIRKRRQLTQKELADLCGLGFSTISHIETAQIHTTIETILLLSDALMVTPNDILEGNYNRKHSRRLAADDEYYMGLGRALADATRDYEHKHKSLT
jgi:transcriptional regulator with XRE-family HTH domain